MRSGCFIAAAMAVTDSEEVLVTSVAVGATTASRSVEELALDLQVFDHGLDHQVAAGERLDRLDRMDPSRQRIALSGIELAFLMQLLPLGEDRVSPSRCGAFETVEQQNLAAGLRSDLCNAAPHGASADHTYVGKVHSHLIIVSR